MAAWLSLAPPQKHEAHRALALGSSGAPGAAQCSSVAFRVLTAEGSGLYVRRGQRTHLEVRFGVSEAHLGIHEIHLSDSGLLKPHLNVHS
jgi:hypothetical protein